MKLTKTNLFLSNVLVVMVAFVVLVGCQIFQFSIKLKSARLDGLSVWSKNDPEKRKTVEIFTAACLEGISNSPPGAPLTIYGCGEKYGTPELVATLKIIDDSVVAPAPLRWL